MLMQLFFTVLISLSITGCATETLFTKAVPREEPQLSEEVGETEISLYYDFKDVAVPRGLEIKGKNPLSFKQLSIPSDFLPSLERWKQILSSTILPTRCLRMAGVF